jgi:hypothetical protein
MDRSLKFKLAAGAAGGLAAAGAGGALAASQSTSPKAKGQALVEDAAHRLGVTPTALSRALKQASEDRVDAAVAAGRLTKREGEALKQHLSSGGFALPLGAPIHDHGPKPGLDAAASYLGLSATQLSSRLESDKSLAQIAEARGKSVDGLIAFLVAHARTHLDAAVKAGRITKTQESALLAGLEQRISAFVHGRPQIFKARPGLAGPPPVGKVG